MIETTNNIIFWTGYLFIFTFLLTSAIYLFRRAFESLANTEKYFKFIFNQIFKIKISKMKEEDLDKWLNEVKKNWKMVN